MCVCVFQADFYIDHSDPSTMQLPSTVEKKYSITPSSQQESNIGDDSQTTVKEQMTVMAAVTAQLAEEEEEIDRQKRALESDVHTRYATGRNLASTHVSLQVKT